MNFNNGEHLTNYCLKIFKNKNIELNTYYRNMILSLSNIYNFYKYLEEQNVLKQYPNRFNNILEFCKNGNMKSLVIQIRYENFLIEKYKIKEKDFDIEEYNIDFLNNKNNITNIYYPKLLEVITINTATDKAYLIKENTFIDNIKYGIYFIYDENNELIYIGKSISDVSNRCFASIKERRIYKFSKIEIRIPNSISDVGIYEAYYISKHKPKLNKDLKLKDIISIKLQDIPIGKIYIKDYTNFKSIEYQYYIKQKVTPIEYFTNKNYILSALVSENQLYKERIFTKNSSAYFAYMDNFNYYNNEIEFYYYEKQTTN